MPSSTPTQDLPRELDATIDRWDREGLLVPGQADRLRADLAAHVPDTPRPRAVASRLEVAVQAGLEALGYLGAALVVGAVTWLLDIPSWPDPGIMVLLAVVAAGCGTAVLRLTPAEPGMASRLVSVVGTAGLFALGGFLALLLEPECARTCGWVEERLVPIALSVPMTVAAGWLYLRERNALTHAWLGIGVASTLLLASQLPFDPRSDAWRSQELVAALVLLPAAVAWVWASETDRLRPAWIGTVGASAVALASTVTIADLEFVGAGGGDLVPLSLLLFGGAWVSLGLSVQRWRLTSIGALVWVWAVPWTLTEVFGLSETTTAALLLPIGLVLVGYASRRLLDR